jgi:hypothetical protein
MQVGLGTQPPAFLVTYHFPFSFGISPCPVFNLWMTLGLLLDHSWTVLGFGLVPVHLWTTTKRDRSTMAGVGA